jgi:hypothetical protein
LDFIGDGTDIKWLYGNFNMTLLEAKDYRNWLLFKKFAVVLGKHFKK